MKIKAKKLITVFKCICLTIVFYFLFVLWLNLKAIEPILKNEIEINARSIAITDIRSKNCKYYFLTSEENLENKLISKHEYNGFSITICYYYYHNSYFNFLFIISPKMLALWYINGYNSKVREFIPEIEQVLINYKYLTK